MTLLTSDIIPILPGLRRYASALTGGVRSGDEYIRVALETLVAEPWRLPSATKVKPELYALLHRTLHACHFRDLDSAAERDGGAADLRHSLLRLPLLDREVLLLVDLEGFSLSDAAELMGLPEFEATWRLAGARRALRRAPRRSTSAGDQTYGSTVRGIATNTCPPYAGAAVGT